MFWATVEKWWRNIPAPVEVDGNSTRVGENTAASMLMSLITVDMISGK